MDSCGSSAAPSQTSSASAQPSTAESAHEAPPAVEEPAALILEGAGNSPANLLHDGLAAEYNGYIYYVDKMMAGNIWKMPVGGGESELLAKGDFHDININGGVIFALGVVPNVDTGLSTYGIFMLGGDGAIKTVKEGYFEELILFDEYLYFAEIIEGGLYRMKYDGSEENLLLPGIYSDFAIIGDALYILASLDEEYVTNIYKMPLDASSEPEMIVNDTFGGSMDIALGEIFYTARSNISGMLRYNSSGGTKSDFLHKSVDYLNTDGEYLYYFWRGIRQDNADSGFYRANLDGSREQMIMRADNMFSINIAGGKIFWHNNDEQRRLSIMNLDGSELKLLEQASD